MGLADRCRMVSDLPRLPVRAEDGHKGLFGRVLVVGGQEHMIGAPVLAGTAALRMGAGLAQIAVPLGMLAAALSITPELIGLGLGEAADLKALLSAAEPADALVIGPGLGQSIQARTRLRSLIRLDKPMVLDADALNILAAETRWPAGFHGRAVLTPHPGEMSRLCRLFDESRVPGDEAGRIELAMRASGVFGQVLVLKGHRTVVTDGRRVYVNQSGDSSLSKAGSGDVLSGMIGCLLGQKMDPFEAAALGAHLHGRAGEMAGEKLGRRCVLARDVIDCLAGAIAEQERRQP